MLFILVYGFFDENASDKLIPFRHYFIFYVLCVNIQKNIILSYKIMGENINV